MKETVNISTLLLFQREAAGNNVFVRDHFLMWSRVQSELLSMIHKRVRIVHVIYSPAASMYITAELKIHTKKAFGGENCDPC